jgi:thiamine pyrophosphate-dependent acetolactate synthase large subunit-like protein
MIKTAEMLELFQRHRGDAIVIPGRGGRFWVDISTRPALDLPLGDPAMGGHAGFALGLALAQPARKIVLFDSEGDLQMSFGVLAMIAEHRPANLYHFLLDNECYATTGGQPVPNAKRVAYDAMARAAGYERTYAFDRLESLAVSLEEILGEAGPVFVAMKIVPEIINEPIGRRRKWRTRTQVQAVADLQRELGIAPS